ncbi:tumor necrosis factor receptor superfamily member 9 [Rhinichthys klamathensis goyatoka]|uniref:tumor necrosis factor receptor superfamily member 9 n=1 Tax=Rhinichthys klamathensis goyatoka TaxID=3034132 RepID=UPI0024B5FBE3|nr:tumor necrosis factor receptor superfamily member 9 [Rhinichthys klamathensis goyatoka]
MFFYMKVLSTLLCLLLLHQNASAKDCPAGKRLDYITQYCVACQENRYNPKSGPNVHCKLCSECGNGSKVVVKCTPTTDIRCQCKEGFTPINQKKENCVCKKGSEVDKRGETCSECRKGYFSDKDDSTCQKWRECKSGIEILGTSTSDAVCKNPSEEVTEAPKVYATSLKTTSLKTTTISSAAPSRTTASSPTKDRFYSLWLVMLCAGILLLSGLLYHKCKVTYCIHNRKKVDSRKDSVCRKPVEESGEKCLSLLV